MKRMKYIAIPFNDEYPLIKGSDYNLLVDQLRIELKRDHGIKGYEVCELISKFSVSFEVNEEVYNGEYLDPAILACNKKEVAQVEQGNPVEVFKFDDLPNEIDKPDDEFVYFGQKPIYKDGDMNLHCSDDIAMFLGGKWDYSGHFGSGGCCYAVRIGSEAYHDAIKAHEQGGPIE